MRNKQWAVVATATPTANKAKQKVGLSVKELNKHLGNFASCLLLIAYCIFSSNLNIDLSSIQPPANGPHKCDYTQCIN